MFALRPASTLRAGLVAALSLAAVSLFAPSLYAADTIPTWNVGSGQPRDNFLLDNNLDFDGNGHEIQLGLRVVYRTSLTPVPLDESTNTYSPLAGTQEDGVVGASGVAAASRSFTSRCVRKTRRSAGDTSLASASTMAGTRLPVSSSGRPMTTAERTAGCSRIAASTSAGYTLAPPVRIMSAIRSPR